jgi:hypothetical protein
VVGDAAAADFVAAGFVAATEATVGAIPLISGAIVGSTTVVGGEATVGADAPPPQAARIKSVKQETATKKLGISALLPKNLLPMVLRLLGRDLRTG